MRTRELIVIVIGCIIACISGCHQEPKSNTVKDVDINRNDITEHGVQILAIDSCEYVWIGLGNKSGLTHKGNCRFCNQRNPKYH